MERICPRCSRWPATTCPTCGNFPHEPCLTTSYDDLCLLGLSPPAAAAARVVDRALEVALAGFAACGLFWLESFWLADREIARFAKPFELIVVRAEVGAIGDGIVRIITLALLGLGCGGSSPGAGPQTPATPPTATRVIEASPTVASEPRSTARLDPSPAAAARPAPSGSSQELFGQGRAAYDLHNCAKASRYFRPLFVHHPREEVTGHAAMLLLDCYVAEGNAALIKEFVTELGLDGARPSRSP